MGVGPVCGCRAPDPMRSPTGSGARTGSVVAVDGLAALGGSQRPEDEVVESVTEGLHRPVAEQEVGPAGVLAAEAPGVSTPPVRVARAGPVGVVRGEIDIVAAAVNRGVRAGP